MLSIFTYPRISSCCLLIYVLSVIFVLTLFGGCSFESKGPKYEIFPPAGGKGAIVVVASGNSGPGLYRDFSSKLAGLGYYTVLMDGKYLFDPGSIRSNCTWCMENLQAVIAESKSSSTSHSRESVPGRFFSRWCRSAVLRYEVEGSGVCSRGLLPSYYYAGTGHEDLSGRVSDACPCVRR
jgi:hypothetical protein